MIRLPVGVSPFDTVKSVSYDQHEILRWIKRLHCNGGFDVDLTYGNGKFYADGDVPTHSYFLVLGLKA